MAIPTCITFFLHTTRHNNATSGARGSCQVKPPPEVPDQPARRTHHTAGVGGTQPRGEACMLVQPRGGEVYVQIWLGIYWVCPTIWWCPLIAWMAARIDTMLVRWFL